MNKCKPDAATGAQQVNPQQVTPAAPTGRRVRAYSLPSSTLVLKPLRPLRPSTLSAPGKRAPHGLNLKASALTHTRTVWSRSSCDSQGQPD